MKGESIHAAIAKSLWMNSAEISRQLDNSLGAIHGIGLAEYMVLLSLMKEPNQTLRRIDIAEALGRTASGITRMLMPMQKIGVVEKATSERDARVSLVKITPAGERIFTDASTTLAQKSASLLKNIDQSKAETLLSLLDSIRDY